MATLACGSGGDVAGCGDCTNRPGELWNCQVSDEKEDNAPDGVVKPAWAGG